MSVTEPPEKNTNQQRDRTAVPRSGVILLVPLLLALSTYLSFEATPLASEPPLKPAEEFRLRNMCSNAAQLAFQSRWGHPPDGITLLGFTNRYDLKANRCYLMVTYREGQSTWFDVSDVRTGKTEAHIKVSSR
jgi:hypothetical protein